MTDPQHLAETVREIIDHHHFDQEEIDAITEAAALLEGGREEWRAAGERWGRTITLHNPSRNREWAVAAMEPFLVAGIYANPRIQSRHVITSDWVDVEEGEGR